MLRDGLSITSARAAAVYNYSAASWTQFSRVVSDVHELTSTVRYPTTLCTILHPQVQLQTYRDVVHTSRKQTTVVS